MVGLKKVSKNIYRLPFDQNLNLKPEPARLHIGPMVNALDFAMKKGTLIFAALSGEVVEAVSKFKKGGPDESLREYANLIRIKHDNGEYSEYGHLRYKGVEVKVGEVVKQGDLIGYSGTTGFNTYPHLHFMVYEFIKQEPRWRSLIPRFKVKGKIVRLRSPKK